MAVERDVWYLFWGMARAKESAQRYQTTLSAAILLAEVVGWERDYSSSTVLRSLRLRMGSSLT